MLFSYCLLGKFEELPEKGTTHSQDDEERHCKDAVSDRYGCWSGMSTYKWIPTSVRIDSEINQQNSVLSLFYNWLAIYVALFYLEYQQRVVKY